MKKKVLYLSKGNVLSADGMSIKLRTNYIFIQEKLNAMIR